MLIYIGFVKPNLQWTKYYSFLALNRGSLAMIFPLGKSKTGTSGDSGAGGMDTRWRLRESASTKPEEIPATTANWPKEEKTINLTKAVEQTGDLFRMDTVSAPPSFLNQAFSGQASSGNLKANLSLAQILSDKEEESKVNALRGNEFKPRLVKSIPPIDPNLPMDEDIKRRFGQNIRSALGCGTIIEGTFSFDSPVCIDGTLVGEVRSNSVLIVGSQASVKAKINVGSLIVMGKVEGDVEAAELVEIRNGGILQGDATSARFAMEEGAWFQGRCIPTTAIPKSAASKNEPTSEAN